MKLLINQQDNSVHNSIPHFTSNSFPQVTKSEKYEYKKKQRKDLKVIKMKIKGLKHQHFYACKKKHVSDM